MTQAAATKSVPPCKGKQTVGDHPMIEIGRCAHRVGGATYVYLESGCPECGCTARQTEMFLCGTKEPRVQPTPDNCLAMKWKADRSLEVPGQ